MATKAQIKFTYEDYKSLPYTERQRFELLEGELIPMAPSPGEAHQAASIGLASLLYRFVRERRLGRVYEAPFDVVLGAPGEEQVVQPDIFFIAQDRLHIIGEEEVRGGPDLVIEVLSPTTAEKDRLFKRRLYAKHGVKEYWLVDPSARTIEVLTLSEQGYEQAGLYGENDELRSPLLPELRFPVREVFY